ncbi:MAG: hypothetical protein LBE84_06785, partial [Planctomycetota bacterium]|nr:hypothetical protein [Planctomycetota bacterium]
KTCGGAESFPAKIDCRNPAGFNANPGVCVWIFDNAALFGETGSWKTGVCGPGKPFFRDSRTHAWQKIFLARERPPWKCRRKG